MTETFDPQDVLARLDALESGLDISQLPLRALMNTLETNWQPDSSTLLQPASIGSDLLASGSVDKANLGTDVLSAFLKLLTAADLELAFGVGSVTFSTSTVSANNTFSHGLKGTPVLVVVSGTDLNTCWWGHNKSATQITVRGSYSTALSTTMGFEWAAIG